MRTILFGIVILYLGALAYIYFTQNSQLFNRASIDKNPSFELKNMEHISLHVEQNVVLNGVYKHSLMKNAPLLIYFGGNADDATRILLYTKSLTDFDIVAFNYRGYLKSTGEPGEQNFFSDALKIFDKYAQNRKVIIIGRSLGTAVATYTASQRKNDGLILITPFDSIASIAKKKYPIFPIDLMLKNKFESIKYMPDVKSPVSIIEVKNDKVVPHSNLEKLKETVPNLSSLVVLENTTHADVLEQKDFKKVLKEMIEKTLLL